MANVDLKEIVRSIYDFPKKGIIFRDITPVLENGEAFKTAIDKITENLAGLDFDIIAAPEARGFIFAAPVAYKLGKGVALVRKKGKLPLETAQKTYELEYGCATIEIHKDSVKKGQKVAIIDDLLATGGTVKAITELISEMGAEVTACSFLIELEELNGRKALEGTKVTSVIKY